MFNFLTHRPLFSGPAAIALVTPPGFLLVWITTKHAAAYGTLLFLALPAALGFCSVILYNWSSRRGLWASLNVAMGSVAAMGSILLLGGIEGLICLAMALAVALPLSLIGCCLGYALADARWQKLTASCLVFLAPMGAPFERQWHRGPGHFMVRSGIEIAAPPELVWQHVITFSEITEKPTSPLLRTGIAYPIRATIIGEGVGAVRQCVFTTGAFEEPIDEWEAPHRLHFSVAKQPPVMHELSWIPDLKPEHITREYLRSRQGQFVLTSLPNGHTLLEGTTWYDLEYWPSSYWHLWSDAIIHRIHMRVLEHIKAEVERSGDEVIPVPPRTDTQSPAPSAGALASTGLSRYSGAGAQ